MRVAHIDQLRDIARMIVKILSPKETASVIALSGDLGAGKTTFVQMVAAELGVTDAVPSPTYILQRTYPLSNQQFDVLVHIDAYRLSGEEELSHIRWSETLSNAKALVCVEWPERIPGQIPADALRVRFDIDGEERIITINGETSDVTGNSR